MSLVLLGILNSQAAAAGGETAYDHLETTTLSSTATSISFTGLDTAYGADYEHLVVRTWLQGTNNEDLILRINSDTGNNYGTNYWQGRSTLELASYNENISYGEIFRGIMDDSYSNSMFQPTTLVIPNWQSSKKKNVFVETAYGDDFPQYTNAVIHYNSTSAINALYFARSASVTMQANSFISLYGIKG